MLPANNKKAQSKTTFAYRNDQDNIFVMSAIVLSMNASIHELNMLSSRYGGFFVLLNRDARKGTSVKDTSKLMEVEATITTENGRNISATIPFAMIMGTNTMISIKVMDMAVNPISIRPSYAACRGVFPIFK
jgi:hypothetical protein